MAIITLLTDFGTTDSYVAELKAVILSRTEKITLVDISHEVPAGDIRAAQYLLSRAWRHFPVGTIHVVVIDPGVGTERRALAAETGGHRFLAPDNGLLSFLPSEARFISMPVPAAAAATFHGRDLFAPAAATLAGGHPIQALGASITHPVRVPLPAPRYDGTAVIGEVIYVDRFGTLISNIPTSNVKSGVPIHVAGIAVGPLHRTFADVSRGALVAFGGSGGTVEIAVRDGNAATTLNVSAGVTVTVGEATVKAGKGR